MGEVTSVDVPELTGIGDAVVGVGRGLTRTAGDIRSWEYALPGTVAGSVTCETAAAESARGWEATLTALGDQLTDFGAGLRRTARDYREADAFAAERLRESGHPAVAHLGGGYPVAAPPPAVTGPSEAGPGASGPGSPSAGRVTS